MAKEIFMTQWFSDAMLLAGQTLIQRLDASEAQVVAAFWIQSSDIPADYHVILVNYLNSLDDGK